MARWRLAFLVRNARELDPQLEFGGTKLGDLTLGPEARDRLASELNSMTPEALEINGYLPVVRVEVEAADLAEALQIGFRQATLSLEPYCLLVPEKQRLDFSRQRPMVLPNALVINQSVDPQTCDFAHYHGASVLRITLGDWLTDAQEFNHQVVRRIAELYPQSLFQAGAPRSELELRIGRAVHWYSQGEGQADLTMAFVCYWIGLEALVLKSSGSSQKEKHLTERINKIAGKHAPDVDWQRAVVDLWKKRSDVVHEGFGASPSGLVPEITAGDLNVVMNLFFMALLYAVEQHSKGVLLGDLWNPRNADHYTPSVVIDPSRFPQLLTSLGIQRGRG